MGSGLSTDSDYSDLETTINGVNNPLHVACTLNDIKQLAWVLEVEAYNLSECDSNGETPLYIACKKSHHRCVELLLQHKTSIACSRRVSRNNSKLELHKAVENNDLVCLELLLKYRAFVDAINISCVKGVAGNPYVPCGGEFEFSRTYLYGMTPLQMACAQGNYDCARLLLRYGADENSKISRKFWSGSSPFGVVLDAYPPSPIQLACVYGHHQIVALLLEYQACPNLAEPEEKMQDYMTLIQRRKFICMTPPLHLACKFGHLKCAHLLIEYGALINLGSPNPEHFPAGCMCTSRQNIETLEKIRSTMSGGAPDELEFHRMWMQRPLDDRPCKTPLFYACESGNIECAKLLLRQGAVVDVDCVACTPLFIACMRGHINCVKLLIAHGANVNFIARYHCSCGPCNIRRPNNTQTFCHGPLTLAMHAQNIELAKVLLAAGALTNNPDEDRWPLEEACAWCFSEGVELLLNEGAAPDSCRPYDVTSTPMSVLCTAGLQYCSSKKGANVDDFKRCVQLLLHHALPIRGPSRSTLRSCLELQLQWQLESNRAMKKDILELCQAPTSLRTLCRMVIRGCVAKNCKLSEGIRALNLPRAVETFLMNSLQERIY
ncbi:ankyrin-1-like [Branchiostoma lanceolatum]|uniref:ankyrin-1-like n=1 Tax=Branchiostoma lanceolatum TaxID=7740 RepID=UPI001132A751